MLRCPAATALVLGTDNTILLHLISAQELSWLQGCSQVAPILGSLSEASQQKSPTSNRGLLFSCGDVVCNWILICSVFNLLSASLIFKPVLLLNQNVRQN